MSLVNDPAQEITPVSGTVTVKTQDGAGVALTSQINGSQRALDIGVNVAGVQIDPRSIRALTLSDIVTANQGAANTAPNAWFQQLTSAGGFTASVSGYGALRVTEENTSLFYDPFDVALDTTNRWNAATVAGTGVATQPAGAYQLSGGTTASSYAVLTSKPTFIGIVPAYAQIGIALKFESGTAITTAHRFWGVGTGPGTPTALAPLTDAVGWEIGTDGKLYAVVYSAGVRTQIADLSASGTNKQPTDGAYHRYVMFMRTDKTYWYIDGTDTPVATSSFQSPSIQALPLRLSSVTGVGAPSATPVLNTTGIAVGDSGRNNSTISDSTNPFYRATVSSAGALKVDNSAVTQPISAASLPLPTGASTETTLAALNTKVTAVNTGAVTISAALPTGANSIGTVGLNTGANTIGIVNQGTAASLANAWLIKNTDGTNTASVKAASTAAAAGDSALVVALSPNSPVAQATLTKGTQGATGVSTQDLKDAGRNQTNYFMTIPVVSTATDALMSLTGYKGGAAVAATTTPAVVTAAKTYRLTSITVTYVTIVTTPGAVKFTLRAQAGGTVLITSPAVQVWTVGEPSGAAPIAGKFNTITIPLPEGIEFAAGTGIGISMVGLSATSTAAAVGFGQISLQGFEY